ncbi:MAG: hypothetical protein EXS32_14070 [Opitutus sp.]|nr:hypothetical protein [Opitutus sp.]
MKFTLFALTLVFAASPAAAQGVEVGSVKFTSPRAPNGGNGNWLEADVMLNAKPAPGTPGLMVSRVRVTLTLGCELPGHAGGERRLDFYRAEAECVALEPGRANVRFYLPPELVKRDQLHGEPKFWSVELALGGRALPAERPNYSASLAALAARKDFHGRAATGTPAHDGLLLPQYLTPFAGDYPRATPSFVRRDFR